MAINLDLKSNGGALVLDLGGSSAANLILPFIASTSTLYAPTLSEAGLFFYDTFTDTNGTALDSHTPETGTGWTMRDNSGSNMEIQGGEVTGDGGLNDGALYTATATYPSDDYDVTAVIGTADTSSDTFSIVARWTDNDNMLALRYNEDVFALHKKVAGTWTTLANPGALGLLPVDGDTVGIRVVGNVAKILYNGGEAMTVTGLDSVLETGVAGVGIGGGLVNRVDTDDVSAQTITSFQIKELVAGFGWVGDQDFGASNASLAGGGNDTLVAQKITLANESEIQALYAATSKSAGSNATVRAVIYSDSSGSITSLLHSTSYAAPALTNETWQKFTFSSNPVLAAGDYWIGVQGSYNGTGTAEVAYDTGGASNSAYEDLLPFGSGTYQAWDVSIYLQFVEDTSTLSLTMPFISSSSALYTPTVTTGAVTLSLPHIASSATLYSPTITTGAVTISLPHIASTSTLYAPTITVGAATLSLPHIASTSQLYSPTITTGAVTIDLPHISSSTALYPPTLSAGASTLELPFIASTTVLYAPTLTVGSVTIELPYISSAIALYAPTVSAGGTSLELPHIASTATLYTPTIATGAVTVSLPHIGSTTTLYTPTITTGAVTITLPHIASTTTLYTPTVTTGATTLELPHISSSTVLYAPTLSTGAATILLPHISSSAQLYAPTLVPGAVTVSLPHIASTTTIYAPTLTVGATTLALPLIASTTTLYAPTITTGAVGIELPFIASTAQLYSPTVTAGAVLLELPFLASAAELFAPEITNLDNTQTVVMPFLNDRHTPRKYYLDSDGNIYWVVNETIGLVERV